MAIVVRASHVLITASDARTGVPQRNRGCATMCIHCVMMEELAMSPYGACGVSRCSLGVQLHTGPTRGTLTCMIPTVVEEEGLISITRVHSAHERPPTSALKHRPLPTLAHACITHTHTGHTLCRAVTRLESCVQPPSVLNQEACIRIAADCCVHVVVITDVQSAANVLRYTAMREPRVERAVSRNKTCKLWHIELARLGV
jgi:hypothetical protein